MIMASCELLHQNSLNSLEILGWLIDVNLDIVYLLTNLFIKNEYKNKYCHFYVRQLNIQIF